MIRSITLRDFMVYDLAHMEFIENGVIFIVGPNGSGKSSLVIGIAVGLGATALGIGRDGLSSLSELVREGASRGEIILKLRNSLPNGKKLFSEIQDDTVEIKRVIYRDGRSYFTIKGESWKSYSKISSKEVKAALLSAGINPENPLVFMQQDMGPKFLALKPEEKLKLVEEVLQVTPYRQRIVEAREELREVQLSQVEASLILKQSEERLKYWETEWRKLSERRQLLKRKEELEERLHLARVHKLAKKRQMLSSRLANIEAELSQIRSTITGLKRVKLDKAIVKLKELENSISSEIDALTFQIRRIERKAAHLSTLRDRKLSELRQAQHKIAQIDKNLKTAYTELENLKLLASTKPDIEERLKRIEQEIDKLEQELSEISSGVRAEEMLETYRKALISTSLSYQKIIKQLRQHLNEGWAPLNELLEPCPQALHQVIGVDPSKVVVAWTPEAFRRLEEYRAAHNIAITIAYVNTQRKEPMEISLPGDILVKASFQAAVVLSALTRHITGFKLSDSLPEKPGNITFSAKTKSRREAIAVDSHLIILSTLSPELHHIKPESSAKVLASLKQRRKELRARIRELRGEERELRARLIEAERASAKQELLRQRLDELLAEKSEAQERAMQLKQEISELDAQLNKALMTLSSADRKLAKVKAALDKVRAKRELLQEKLRKIESQIDMLSSKERDLSAEAEDLRREIQRIAESLPDSIKPLEPVPKEEDILRELAKVEVSLEAIGDVIPSADEMYMKALEEYNKTRENIEKIQERKLRLEAELNKRIATWKKTLRALIREVDSRYQELLREIGATGRIILHLEDNPESSWLELSAKFHESSERELKKAKASGGEKALATLSFLIALQECSQSPVKAIDEFDAHLDPMNKARILEVIYSAISRKDILGQYFLVTPSSLPAIDWSKKNVQVIAVNYCGVQK